MRLRRVAPWLLLTAAVLGGGLYIYDKLLPPRFADTLPTADRVVVRKAERTLSLVKEGAVLKSYRVSLGRDPVGHKQVEGDGRTPEGSYLIDWRNPRSRFHLSLHISYPDENDRRQASARGVSPGGDIMIHGLPNLTSAAAPLFAGRDWTNGCIAVSNIEIEEIWRAVPDGTPIDILP
jgi:murein L,D-transpeptidase YafK